MGRSAGAARPLMQSFSPAQKDRLLKKGSRNSLWRDSIAAEADVMSASAVLVEDKVSAEIEGEKQFRIPEGYDSLLGELIAPLPSESLHLETVITDNTMAEGQGGTDCRHSIGRARIQRKCRDFHAAARGVAGGGRNRGAVAFVPVVARKRKRPSGICGWRKVVR